MAKRYKDWPDGFQKVDDAAAHVAAQLALWRRVADVRSHLSGKQLSHLDRVITLYREENHALSEFLAFLDKHHPTLRKQLFHGQELWVARRRAIQELLEALDWGFDPFSDPDYADELAAARVYIDRDTETLKRAVERAADDHLKSRGNTGGVKRAADAALKNLGFGSASTTRRARSASKKAVSPKR